LAALAAGLQIDLGISFKSRSFHVPFGDFLDGFVLTAAPLMASRLFGHWFVSLLHLLLA
jgi:hypothetical protein